MYLTAFSSQRTPLSTLWSSRTWLQPSGQPFAHVFSHRESAYEFDANDLWDWMAQTFFNWGTMPSDDLRIHFQRDLWLIDHWRLAGTHDVRTLRAWLAKLDHRKAVVRQIMAEAYGPQNETSWLVNWRLFFLICSEVWNLGQGTEYLVSHYLFGKRESSI
jgi:cyclopropane-fatty-acyl-phospholipid synthase